MPSIYPRKSIGNKVLIPRITFLTIDTDYISLRRQQFLKLAFSMTINKSQGQTIKKVGIMIDSPLFSHGHLYTAMSRVCDPSNLKIMLKKKTQKQREIFNK